jgi:hypothetical protein
MLVDSPCRGAVRGVLLVPGAPNRAADHLDPPTRTDPTLDATPDIPADIADIFTWYTADKVNVIVTFGGPSGLTQPASYDRDVLYKILISTAAPTDTPDVVIRARFGPGAKPGEWGVRFEGVPGVNGAIEGPVETTPHQGRRPGARGLFDEPFFFDLQGFPRIALARGDPLPQHAQLLRRQQRHRAGAVDPQGPLRLGDHAARLLDDDRALRRAEVRALRPVALAAALLLLGACEGSDGPAPTPTPSPTPTPTATAVSYNVENCFTQTIPGTGGQTLRSLIVPDTLKLDLTRESHFPNGRDLDDKVIDITLAALFLDFTVTGQSPDTFANLPLNPPANDRPFSTTFPFLAPPQGTPPLAATTGPASISAPIPTPPTSRSTAWACRRWRPR